MTLLGWIKARLERFSASRKFDRRGRRMASERESGSYGEGASGRYRSFEVDYRDATHLLKLRMNEVYPGSYHARLSSSANASYGYGEQRAGAVDKASTAIAMALRSGATVSEAAEAGAVSIGI